MTLSAAPLAAALIAGSAALAEEEEPSVPALPEAPPSAVLVDQVTLDSRSDNGTDTTEPLLAGQTYIVEASGIVSFGPGLADAECANLGTTAPTFKREYFPSVPDTVDILVDRTGREWTPLSPDAENCDTTNHVYRVFVVPQTTKRYNFVFNDGGWRGDNSGIFTIRVFLTDQVAPAGSEIDQFAFAASDADGGDSNAALAPNRSYRIQISGGFTFDQAGHTHDAECLWVDGAPAQRTDALDDTTQTPDVLVASGEVDWVPVRGRTGCDDRGHTYILEVAGMSGSVNLRVRDNWHQDNVGLLSVKIFDLGPTAENVSQVPEVDLPDLDEPPSTSSPLPSDVLVEEVLVDARSDNGASTTQPLVAGQAYVLQVGGVVRFGNGIADAECAAFDLVPTFKREYFPTAPDTVDLLVDGVGREWTAVIPDVEGCNTTDHTYTGYLVPQTTKRFTFLFNDGGWRGDNSGQLTVRVFLTDRVPPAGTQIDQFALSATDADGVDSSVTLSPTRSYRVQVAGSFTFNNTGAVSDAECVQAPPGTPGQRQDGLDDTGSTPDVLLQVQEIDWVPVRGRTGCDDRGHTYIAEFAEIAGTVNLRVRDTWHGDNSGTLQVTIFDLGVTTGDEPGGPPVEAPIELPEAPDVPPESVLVEQLTVDSRSDSGTTTLEPLATGQTYIIEAGGLVVFGAGQADAECANLGASLPTFKREYFPSAPHTADLIFDGVGREWMAITSDTEGCNTTSHTYRLFYVPETTRQVTFLFNDGGWRGDNSGTFTVRIFLADGAAPAGALVDQFTLDAANPSGANSSLALAPTTAYRIQVSGSFTFTDNASTHDAECLQVAGTPGQRQDVLDEVSATPDVLFRQQQVSWIAAKGRTGCDDRTHAYILDVSGVAGSVNLRVRDVWHGDNAGLLDVKIFELGPAA